VTSLRGVGCNNFGEICKVAHTCISFRYDYRLNGRLETFVIGRYSARGLTLALAREKCVEFLWSSVGHDGFRPPRIAFVSLFIEMKAFSLFSILFGFGLAMQFERLSPGEGLTACSQDASSFFSFSVSCICSSSGTATS
jgi:hypothetical protein